MDDLARLARWHRLSADAADRQMTRAGRTAWSKADRALADYVLALLTDPLPVLSSRTENGPA